MSIRDEGIRLRVLADVASLRSGKRELQEWSREITNLSSKIRQGLGTKEDFRQLKEYQGFVARSHREYLNRLKEYERETGQRGGGAPQGGPGMVTRGLRMGQAIPIVGGMLTGGFIASQIMQAARWNIDLAKSASEVSLAFSRSAEDARLIAENIREAGKEVGFLEAESVRASTAMARAGGPLMAGIMQPGGYMSRLARAEGIDYSTLTGLVGGAGGAGAFMPGLAGATEFARKTEAARLSAKNFLTTEQYLNTITPFLQAQGKFAPTTGTSADAFNRLFTGLTGAAGEDPRRERFVARNIGGVSQQISEAIRRPRGETAEFFTLRALGLGRGRSLYEVRKRQERGMDLDNLRDLVKEAKKSSELRIGGMSEKESFAQSFNFLTGMTRTMGEMLHGVDLTTDATLKAGAIKAGLKFDEEGIASIEDPRVTAMRALEKEMEALRKIIGELATEVIPSLVTALQYIKPGGGLSESEFMDRLANLILHLPGTEGWNRLREEARLGEATTDENSE